MRQITLKTANYPTTVSRAKIRKAIQEVYSTLPESKAADSAIPEVNVVVTNRLPKKTKK